MTTAIRHRHILVRFTLALLLFVLAGFGHAEDKAAVVEIGLVHVNDVYQIPTRSAAGWRASPGWWASCAPSIRPRSSSSAATHFHPGSNPACSRGRR